MPSIEGRATAADGTVLLTRHWPADEAEAGGAWAGDPWASVLIVHGIGEHSGRYEHVGDQMAAAGLDVHAYDHRGNGGSGGRRGHVDRWSEFHDDLGGRLAAVRASAAGSRPVAIYGHSLGGLIVAGYCLADPPRPKPDLVVLSAPALESTLASWKQVLAPLLGRIAPTIAIPTVVDGTTISRDPSVAAKTVDDPLCVKVTTMRLGSEGLKERARVRTEASRGLGVPTLVLHGLDDGLVPHAASELFAGAPLTDRRTYPGLRHELHNEPEGPQVVDEIIIWLREQILERGTLTA
jgi:alpha-beta hydrolase superfamily lysophospholipase